MHPIAALVRPISITKDVAESDGKLFNGMAQRFNYQVMYGKVDEIMNKLVRIS